MILVYTYVCGDIIHPGHLLYLQNARALGDRLIVGVLTDKAVMEKKVRPAIPFEQRLQLIQSLSFVDCSVPQSDYSPLENLKIIKPEILVESGSHLGEPYLGNIREEFRGRIVMLPYYPTQSSTAIKQTIKGAS